MKILESIKLKKCKDCQNDCSLPIKFKFNYYTLKINCYWKYEEFYDNGEKAREYWFKDDNIQHRDDGPAEIWYFGNYKKEAWFRNGNFIKRTEREYYDNTN